ncbi:MAG: hypothetical protein IPN69_16385 [Acidobacteria bacterium]|nr:hypothetical protein [Acidobacteriota bacterium]
MKNYRVVATYSDGRATFESNGTIEYICDTVGGPYLSWQMFDQTGTLLGGRIRSYFLGTGVSNTEVAIQAVIRDIERYRIGRRRCFSNIRLQNFS